MKRFASIALAVGSVAVAAPAFACPNMDRAENAPATQTADKTKAATPAPSPTQTKDTANTATDSKATAKADAAKKSAS